MSPRFVLGQENVPCVSEVVNRSLKADCTDYTDMAWSPDHIVAVIASIDLSQEIFAIDMFTALESSLKHRRKHVRRWLRLYRDQA